VAVARQYLVGASAILAAVGLGLGCGDSSSDDDPDGGGGQGGGGIDTFTLEPAAGGIRVLTSSQLRYSLEYILGVDAAAGFEVWSDSQLHGFESIGAAELALGSNDISTLETEVTQAVDAALLDVAHLAAFVPCVQSSPDAACYTTVATELGRIAWRRPMEADEIARLVAIAEQGQTWGGGDFDVGLKYQLMAVFQSPHFIYMPEIGEGEPGMRVLGPYELASRMAFFLQHRTPDVTLLDAAESGGLADDEGIRAQARRLLATPEARRGLDRFFGELYLIRDIPLVSKDATLFPEWTESLALSMQEEMLRSLQDVVWTRDADAREIFTSEDTFVDATLAAFYGVTGGGAGWTKVVIPGGQERFGLMGKAGLMARFAGNDETSPTKRGRFFRERIMCREIPAPPAGVDTTLDPPTGPMTMRQRLEPHRSDESCAGCHALVDPIGLAYEHFDGIGRYRETDEGLEIITADESLGLEFEGPTDLAQIARDSAAACLAQSFWRQSMGHVETDGEADSLALLEESFAEQGYSLQSLMVELTVSPAFKRVGEPK
jgi:hypothetical protein